MPVMQFTVVVTWNGGTGVVQVNPDPVPAYQATQGGNGQAQITWNASNGTFGSGAFAWKTTPNPGWSPTMSGGNLVSPVFTPGGEPNWFYNITITDSGGTPHTLDPEIENIPPGPGSEGRPPGQIGKP